MSATALRVAKETGLSYHRNMISTLEEIWDEEEKPEPVHYWKILKTAFDQTIMETPEGTTGVFDRTLLDNLAACLLCSHEQVNDSVCQTMLLLTKEHLDKYDQIFYFPLSALKGPHLARELALDLIIRSLMEYLGVRYQTTETVDVIDEVKKLKRHGGRSVG